MTSHIWPRYPQTAATPEQETRMQEGWDRLIDKARRDARRIDEESRLQQAVARLRPTDEMLATIIQMMRLRR